jgi:uracil-DNA glycosylase family 4
MELIQIEQEVKNCKNCGLSKTRNNPVFGKGFTKAEIMFIRETSGFNEEELENEENTER